MNAAESPIEREYRRRTPRSRSSFERGLAVIGGGVSRAATYWAPYPLTMVAGRGSRLTDVDGNEYLDLLCNHTSLIHGHGFPPVVEAVDRALRKGTAWSALSEPQNQLAELICDRIASVERVRFTNSGTEAAELALSICRAVTGRRKIIMARYGYHGSTYGFMSGSMGRGDVDVLLGEFGDAESFRALLADHRDEIAGVFLEPVQGAGGINQAPASFFQTVADAARAAGALFVLDEVVALRLALGGRQEVLGLDPDLTLMAKIIGGGFPVGAVGGKEKWMRVFDPASPAVHHAGTFNANPITMAAGLAAYRALDASAIERLDQLGADLQQRLHAAAVAAGLPVSINRVGSLLNIFFMASPPKAVTERSDGATMRLFHLAAMNHGLFLAERGMMALSTVLDESSIDELVERAADAFRDVAAECAGAPARDRVTNQGSES